MTVPPRDGYVWEEGGGCSRWWEGERMAGAGLWMCAGRMGRLMVAARGQQDRSGSWEGKGEGPAMCPVPRWVGCRVKVLPLHTEQEGVPHLANQQQQQQQSRQCQRCPVRGRQEQRSMGVGRRQGGQEQD